MSHSIKQDASMHCVLTNLDLWRCPNLRKKQVITTWIYFNIVTFVVHVLRHEAHCRERNLQGLLKQEILLKTNVLGKDLDEWMCIKRCFLDCLVASYFRIFWIDFGKDSILLAFIQFVKTERNVWETETSANAMVE